MFGEDFNEALRKHVAESLTKSGHLAVAPTLSPKYKTEKSERYVLASTFSERHAAYASGLGTFGLCDGLITAKGKAMRCGTVVARHTNRPQRLVPTKIIMLTVSSMPKGLAACAPRCPGGAVTSKSGHDKLACMKQLAVTTQYPKNNMALPDTAADSARPAFPANHEFQFDR